MIKRSNFLNRIISEYNKRIGIFTTVLKGYQSVNKKAFYTIFAY